MRAVTTQTNQSITTWRLAPAWRKGLLVLHVISGISWMGVDIAVFILLMTARTSDDPALVVSGFNANGGAMEPKPLTATSATIDVATRQQIVELVSARIQAHYVFPEIANQVAEALNANLQSNRYAPVAQAPAFAEQLTQDLRAITHDKHMNVSYVADPLPERPPGAERPTPEELAQLRQQMEKENFGVARVECLPLNIGYIDLRYFGNLAWVAESITAAMTLIAHTDALIVDLRQNGGGDPNTVAFMTSYLLDERTHLNSFYLRQGDRIEQFWTQEWVPGKRFGQRKPVYVLTANFTFSGAEEFSYNLKHLKRATIVGETTGGGAHPGRKHRLSPHFQISIPDGRAINPITNTNWEGVGVEPDVPVAASDALRVAQVLARKRLAGGTS